MAKFKHLLALGLITLLVPAQSQSIHHHHGSGGGVDDKKGIPRHTLENWASSFGGGLYQFLVSITKYNDLQNRFSTANNVDVKPIDLAKMIVEMTDVIKDNLNKKKTAVMKVMEWAEEKALEYYDKKPEDRPKRPTTYYNSKKLNMEGKPEELFHKVSLKADAHFKKEVNTSFSSVHVPTNIYEKKDDVIDSIGWSSNMDERFVTNYDINPSLSYQYFGSATGFMRHYPAMKWPNDNSVSQNPDLYDCRTRPWYVQAANSPKNMFILHDVSGSMTGIRREIGKHVVNTLLDTLTENDFVNVYNFSDSTTPVVPCFRNRMVQANLENIRELKVGLEQDHTAGIANFTSALTMAFDILEKVRQHNDTKDSSDCNQAIMIVTDGAPFFFEEIFKARQNMEHYVRVFTYLIGREVTEKREVQWMACSNRGYFTHVSTLSEVQEKVLKYMPVMSRPMVIEKKHVENWTPVYSNIDSGEESSDNASHSTNPGKNKTCKCKSRGVISGASSTTEHEQPDTPQALPINSKKIEARLQTVHAGVYSDYRSIIKKADKEEYFPTPAKPKDPTEPFNFVISVSTPVFDQRNSTIVYEKVRVNASFTYDNPIEERIAVFLGVAGTDIPIKELKKMASPFKLGVNGYAFMINNNGYIIFHPDWRPVFNGELLKPNYNTVDISEVELVDRDNNYRNNDSLLLDMRTDMIEMEKRGYKKEFRVRIHQDNFTEEADDELLNIDDEVLEGLYEPRYVFKVRKMQDHFRRVSIRNQMYEYHKLQHTPYTLGIVTPEKANRFHGEIELRIEREKVLDFFNKSNEPRKWKINPDWSYCDYVRGGENYDFPTKEDQIVHFLNMIKSQPGNNWPWKNLGTKHRHQHSHPVDSGGGAGAGRWQHSTDGGHGIYECDKELVQSLVFDANATQIFKEGNLWKFDKNDNDLLKMNGATSAFVATRSGLTRWMDFTTSFGGRAATRPDTSDETMKFIEANSGATNELWYRRAVERYEHDPMSFVYSVPYDAGSRNDSKVTATRAIFVKKGDYHAPVAVVGAQFNHSQWKSRFEDITSGTFDKGGKSTWTCSSGEYDCFVLDDNGFILYSRAHEETGKFFGQVDGMVMEMLVNSDVYKRVRVVDYQAVCFQPVSKSNFASGLRTPIVHIANLFNWLVAQIAWTILQLNLHSFFNPDYASVLASMSSGEDPPHEVVEDIGYTLPPYIELAAINKTRLRPCDKETFLYTYGSSYNSHNFSYHGLLTRCGHSGCNGHFNVHYIPYTNLILVATDGTCQCALNSSTIKQREVQYRKVFSSRSKSSSSSKEDGDEDGDDLLSSSPVEVCRTPKASLHRRRPHVCINYNAEEKLLGEDCGRAHTVSISYLLLLSSLFIALLCSGRRHL